MESSILQSLPNIHGALVGIGAAFFSGFAMYAYQQLQESKDTLEKALKEAGDFSSPPDYIGCSNGFNMLTEQGELDWSEARKLLHTAKFVFFDLNHEESLETTVNGYSRTHTDDEVLSAAEGICFMFHYLFASYPFNGESTITVPGVTEKIVNRRSEAFSSERMRELEMRISFLSNYWVINHRSLLALGRKATEIERKKVEEAERDSYNKSIAIMGEMSEVEKKNLWIKYHQPRINIQADYSILIDEYFNKVTMYKNHVLPQLSDILKKYETFNNRFKLKKTITSALNVIAFVLVFGVITPMLIMGLEQDIGLKFPTLFPYALLIISFSPYIYIWTRLYCKVKHLNHG